MKLKDALIAARKLIERPECWTQGRYLDFSNTGIRQYCAAGACREVSGADDFVGSTVFDATEARGWNELCCCMLSALREYCRGGGTTTFNDTHTHAEVLAVFDKAIAKADQLENPKPKVRP